MAKGDAEFAPAGFFVLRTPVLPIDELLALSEGLTASTSDADPVARAASVARDRAVLTHRLQALVRRPEVREALFVASPSLDDAVSAWLEDAASPRAHGVLEIVVRYVTRLASRPTPFGLFSGCSVGRIGDTTRLELPPLARNRRHTRLDMHYLSALAEAIDRDPALRAGQKFRPNSSLFRSGQQLRYAESYVDPTTRDRSYHLISLELSDYLLATLDRAANGAVPSSLAGPLVDDEITIEEANGYIDTLIDAQILTSDLAPSVTGDEPIHGLIERLSPGAPEVAARLVEVRERLAEMDAAGAGLDPARYRAIASSLSSLPASPDLARLFHVDVYKPAAAATLGPQVVREIDAAVKCLHRIAPRGEDPALEAFKAAFRERYEDREVPLVDALDEERGIGFDSASMESADAAPLLDGLDFPPALDVARVPHGAREDALLHLLARALASGDRTLVLSDADFEPLAEAEPQPLPDAFAVMGTLIARSAEAIAQGDFEILFATGSGPSGASLLGRFCHGDAELRKDVEAHLHREEAKRPDAVFAEVVHLPEGRLGNILCRPVMREHEIVYLGEGGSPEDRRIAITDLRVSVRGGRIRLRSERLNRDVVPRLTSAHNFARATLGTYRFLCSLQSEATVRGLRWSWGPCAGAPFLPRVVWGKIVLSVAQWRLGRADIKLLADADADATAKGDARYVAMRAVRDRLGLPRWVALADFDNVLTVDLDNVAALDSFVQIVKGRTSAVLHELYPSPEQLCVTGPEGRFTHEIIVPYESRRAPSAPTAAPRAPRSLHAPRVFPPGSEWLYAKIYVGSATADAVLREAIAPLVADVTASGDADRWFFIRYGDPGWHLRLRFHGDPARLASGVLPRLHERFAPLVRDGLVSKMQLDTYQRELERYGGDAGIDLAERFFHVDSDCTLQILSGLSGDSAALIRSRLALRGLHLLALDMGLDLTARLELLTQVSDGFLREHRAGVDLKRQLGAKFREGRVLLAALLGDEPPDPSLAPGYEAFAERSRRLAPIAAELRDAAGRGAIDGSFHDVVGSYLHMHANRLLRSSHRAHEMVLYDSLRRLYESEAARSRPKATKK